MTDYCYCECEMPSVMHCERREAMSEHHCCECDRTIRRGETYEHTWGVWDGSTGTYDTCSHCLALREYVTAHIPCFCWCFTAMRDDALELLRDYAHEAPGLFFAGARLYVRARQLRAQERAMSLAQ